MKFYAMNLRYLVASLLLGAAWAVPAQAETESAIAWQKWSPELFKTAETEERLVYLNLEAVWCHWCHVMEKETYSNAEVQTLLKEHFLTVKEDQDSRPDLSNRYKDYGWPATIVLNANGVELFKRAGFVPPDELEKLLKEAVAHPDQALEDDEGTGNITAGPLSEEVRAALRERHYSSYDPKEGGLRVSHKFLDVDGGEYSYVLSEEGSEKDREMLEKTALASLALHDPVWGGVYQYSTYSDWQHPHYEKIMSVQAEQLRLLSLVGERWNDAAIKDATARLQSYLKTFLRDSSGAFYVSQDADLVKGEKASDYFALDDAARRKKGIPRIDTHLYARENGWAARALAVRYATTGDDEARELAEQAVRWTEQNRRIAGSGGFRHDAVDQAGPYLGDTLAMGQAFLALYGATAERSWLTKAEAAATFIERNFMTPQGFQTSVPEASSPLAPVKDRAENIAVARWLNLLSYYAGSSKYRDEARIALGYVGQRKVALDNITEAGILLADDELAKPPLHLTVVGPKKDDKAALLFREALKAPRFYVRTEWYDRAEGALPGADVQYPVLPKPAAFLCTDKRCSLPIFEPAGIPAMIQKFLAPKTKPGQSN